MVKRGHRCTGPKHQKEKRSMDYFAGLDVSVKDTSICIVDDTGRITRETSTAAFLTVEEPEPPQNWSHAVSEELSASLSRTGVTWKLISLATLTRQSGDCPFTGGNTESSSSRHWARNQRKEFPQTGLAEKCPELIVLIIANERQTGVDDLSRGEDERARVIHRVASRSRDRSRSCDIPHNKQYQSARA